jgi:hypothetical protein
VENVRDKGATGAGFWHHCGSKIVYVFVYEVITAAGGEFR